MRLSEALKAANLSMADVERLTDGVLTINRLKRASADLQPLDSVEAALVNQVIAAWRMAETHAKSVVFSAVQGLKASK
jgi:hypothetical protein